MTRCWGLQILIDSPNTNLVNYPVTPNPFQDATLLLGIFAVSICLVEVAFSGDNEKGENIKSSTTPMKILPPWMINVGMNYTKEQLGEIKPEANVGGKLSVEFELSDKKSTIVNNEAKNIQDEYVKACYAAILQRQREQEEMSKAQESPNATTSTQLSTTLTERQVGASSRKVMIMKEKMLNGRRPLLQIAHLFITKLT